MSAQAYPTLYPGDRELFEWLSQTFHMVEEHQFQFGLETCRLRAVCHQVELGKINPYVAMSAIREFNDEHDTTVNFADLLECCTDYVMAGVGEWAVFTDVPEWFARGEGYRDLGEAVLNAPSWVTWIIFAADDYVTVERSPICRPRDLLEVSTRKSSVAYGLRKGDFPAFVLPPELEAALWQIEKQETVWRAPQSCEESHQDTNNAYGHGPRWLDNF